MCLLTVEKGIKGFLHHPEFSEGAGYCVTLSLAGEQLHASEKMDAILKGVAHDFELWML